MRALDSLAITSCYIQGIGSVLYQNRRLHVITLIMTIIIMIFVQICVSNVMLPIAIIFPYYPVVNLKIKILRFIFVVQCSGKTSSIFDCPGLVNANKWPVRGLVGSNDVDSSPDKSSLIYF